MNTQVLIIGAGPTGLMLANQLQCLAIDFEIVDIKEGPTDQSRALAVTARSMELYQQLGLSDKILEESVKLAGFKIFQNGKAKANVSFRKFGEGLSDFPNIMNIFEQSKNEELLNENLVKQHKQVLWQHEFISQKETDNGIEVELKDLVNNESKIINAVYLVGCDGASSPVRKSLNLQFEGGTYENNFFVVDTALEWDLGYEKGILSPTDKMLTVFLPFKGNQRMRIIGTLPHEFSDQDDFDFEDLEKLIKQHTKLKFEIKELGWHSIYRIHHRCVDRFRKGNVFLAGDSAHIHSPAGGQGMNTGLQDAHNLAWKLAFFLKGMVAPSILDTYNEERLPFARSLLNSTDRGFTLLASEHFLISAIRKFLIVPTISRVMKTSTFARLGFKRVSQIEYNYCDSSLSQHSTKQSIKFKAGERMPYLGPNYFKQFSNTMFHLVRISEQSLSNDEIAALKENFPFEVNLINEKITSKWAELGVQKSLFILVRPDQYILRISDTLSLDFKI